MEDSIDADFSRPAATGVSAPPLTVSQLNSAARRLLESRMPLVWVAGELSNFTRAPSGHCYFSLKDDKAQVRCVLFRNRAQALDWVPGNGVQVEVRAAPSLYEPRGEFQLTVDFMRRAGQGLLYERFAKLKAKLAAEGLFDAQRKRALPAFARRVGVITSPRGAALHDVLTTLARRLPQLPVIVYPTQVQGEAAAAQIADALERASARGECDVLLLCRGGGSMEDLWCFNDERVARAVVACSVPVVSGVGHETDFTIVDFVADLRAPTPTAAATLVSPDRTELAARLEGLERRLRRCTQHTLQQRAQQIDFLARRLVHPARRIEAQAAQVGVLARRLSAALERGLRARASRCAQLAHRMTRATPAIGRLDDRCANLGGRLRAAWSGAARAHERQVQSLALHLKHLSPTAVLQRGYSIVAAADGTIVRDAAELNADDIVSLTFAQGTAKAKVQGGET